MTRVRAALALAATLVWASSASAAPIQLITNGNFETGTFAGWTTVDLAGSFVPGAFLIDTPGTTTPTSGNATAGTAANGAFYAVSDQGGAGTHALLQSFTLGPSSSVILSFDMFVNNQSGGGTIVPAGGALTHTAGPAQFGRVDILTSAAGAFDTGAGVLANYFTGADAPPNPNSFTTYLFDITALVGAGGTFQLRFAEADNQLFFNMGVDNVSILADADAAVPEPATMMLLASGLLLIGARQYRRRR